MASSLWSQYATASNCLVLSKLLIGVGGGGGRKEDSGSFLKARLPYPYKWLFYLDSEDSFLRFLYVCLFSMGLAHIDTENSPLLGPQWVAPSDRTPCPSQPKGVPDLDDGYCFPWKVCPQCSLCRLHTTHGPVSYLCNELEHSPGLRTQVLYFFLSLRLCSQPKQ